MIRSFRDDQAERLFHRRPVKKLARPPQRVAQRKLLLVDAPEALEDLRVPPGNRLEKLAGDRAGQYSIRINDQWRICFEWSDGDAYEVEIADYH
jgi:proteic killer suppression protein